MSDLAPHHEHRPSPRLAAVVERAVGYRLTGYPPGVHVGMPSTTVTLVIPLEEPLTLSDPVMGGPRPFGSVIAGLAAAPTWIHHDGSQHGLQLALRPLGVRALFGCPAADLAGSSYELADLLGPGATRLRERLHEIDSWQGRFALVEEMLVRLVHAGGVGRGPEPEVAEAWRLIGASGGVLPIGEVAERVGWSRRRLQTRFGAELGVTPKSAAVVRRFERSVPLVATGGSSLADVAVRCGWSDHAHMDRDWRALAGAAPSRWRAEDALHDTGSR
ncbi:MAG: AraC family transcriptional regulator [Terracoccus sp.]